MLMVDLFNITLFSKKQLLRTECLFSCVFKKMWRKKQKLSKLSYLCSVMCDYLVINVFVLISLSLKWIFVVAVVVFALHFYFFSLLHMFLIILSATEPMLGKNGQQSKLKNSSFFFFFCLIVSFFSTFFSFFCLN